MLRGDRRNQRSAREQKSPPGVGVLGTTPTEARGARGGDEEEQSHAECQDCQRHEPAGGQLPRRERE